MCDFVREEQRSCDIVTQNAVKAAQWQTIILIIVVSDLWVFVNELVMLSQIRLTLMHRYDNAF